ncbi:hypothetical protein K474DRAFT_1659301 [Panus rudis PR-1116 ss-1]|nr:hypothetical protein K474DRAFT_1659301 [Panus rudis PR-1116 ss-1]
MFTSTVYSLLVASVLSIAVLPSVAAPTNVLGSLERRLAVQVPPECSGTDWDNKPKYCLDYSKPPPPPGPNGFSVAGFKREQLGKRLAVQVPPECSGTDWDSKPSYCLNYSKPPPPPIGPNGISIAGF